jgi:adenosylhomocysteine nucleosidase
LGERPARLGIMGAMPDEVDALVRSLDDAARTDRAGRRFHTGRLDGLECVVVHSRCGKVAAAATTVELIVTQRVDAVIFTGVAGRIREDLDVGDVVVASALMQHDMDASPLFPRYEIPMTGVSVFRPDPSLTSALRAAAESFLAEDLAGVLPEDVKLELLGSSRRVVEGLVVSGDRFVADAGEVRELRARLPEAACVEMEGAAVAQVCSDYSVPFGVVRTISDGADDNAHEHFLRSLPAIAGAYSLGILTRAVGALV